jgi:hypothetical protein
MKWRVLSSFMVLAYLSAVIALGVCHHHEHADADGHDSHCAACQWHLQSNAEPPAGPIVLPFLKLISIQACIPIRSQAQTLFPASTDCRAPPIPVA